MAVDWHSEEGRLIRQLIPIATLPAKQFKILCRYLNVEEAANGDMLFKIGDQNSDLVYLLKGTISLNIDTLKIETISAGSDSARFALAHQIPRKVNGVANGKIRFLRLNADMMKSAENSTYEENESNMIDEDMSENDDWMTTLLKAPIFRALPPANLQKIMMSLHEVRYRPGEVIIKQGEVGDFYYIIKKGQCLISRKPAPNAKDIKLGELTVHDSFGEDALISGQPRSVSITAIGDVSLLRLGKEQFITLIKQPVLKYVTFDEAQDMLSRDAEFIDVREPDAFKLSHLPGSINVPIFSLRMQLKTLKRYKPLIVVCRNGKDSETASFILLRHKLNALVLKGGIEALSADQLVTSTALPRDSALEVDDFAEQVSDFNSSEIPAQDGTESVDAEQAMQKLKNQCSLLEVENKALEERCTLLAARVEVLEAELRSAKNQ